MSNCRGSMRCRGSCCRHDAVLSYECLCSFYSVCLCSCNLKFPSLKQLLLNWQSILCLCRRHRGTQCHCKCILDTGLYLTVRRTSTQGLATQLPTGKSGTKKQHASNLVQSNRIAVATSSGGVLLQLGSGHEMTDCRGSSSNSNSNSKAPRVPTRYFRVSMSAFKSAAQSKKRINEEKNYRCN